MHDARGIGREAGAAARLLAFAGAAALLAACASRATPRRGPDAVPPDAHGRGSIVYAPAPRAPAGPAHARGLALLAEGRYPEARAALAEAAREAPGDPGVALDEALAVLGDGEGERAVMLLDRLLAASPDEPLARLARAHALVDAGRTQDGYDAARALVDARPEWAAAWYAWGRAALALRRLGDAAIAFERVLDEEPGHEAALLGLLSVASHDPDGPTWADMEARARDRLAGDPDALVIRGAAAERRGDPEAAEALYREALARDPDHALAHLNLGHLAFDRRGIEPAAPHFQAFLRRAPASARSQAAEVRRILQSHGIPETP